MPNFRDLTDQRFGYLTARWPAGKRGKQTLWLSSCDCGGLAYSNTGNLTSGNSLSCGCRRTASLRRRNSDTHHMSCTPTWNSWDSMWKRCTNAAHVGYHNYGGRGITICDRWRKFEDFLADMGIRPEGMTLDRINNDGNYEPSNCKWSTPSEQAKNRRSEHLTKL